MTTAARDVTEAAHEGDGHSATARSQTVVTAMTDGGGCGSRKQEAAAHRHASKASSGSIAGRGAAFCERNIEILPRTLESLQAASCPDRGPTRGGLQVWPALASLRYKLKNTA